MTDREYPAWVCNACGIKHGRRMPTCATWHPDTCGVCGLEAVVTEPRDFGHLKDSWKASAALAAVADNPPLGRGVGRIRVGAGAGPHAAKGAAKGKGVKG